MDSAQKEFESLRGLGLKYHTMHHTFWANFVAWHTDLAVLRPRFHMRRAIFCRAKHSSFKGS